MPSAHSIPRSLDVRDIYAHTYRARQFETSIARVFAEGRVEGWMHSALGQELGGTVLGLMLRDGDALVPATRSRSAVLSKGSHLAAVAAEFFGRTTGLQRGRGKEHLADRSLNILGTTGIIGATMPLGVGAAFSCAYREDGFICAVTFGDGAVAQGAFHESLNIAALWKLPLVFVCENNGYAEFSLTRQTLAQPEIYRYAEAYGIPGLACDAYELDDLLTSLGGAIKRARAGEGPTLVELRTYRWSGHFEGDPQKYRSKDEVASWKARDFIPRLRERVVAEGASSESLAQLERELDDQVSAAIKTALSSPTPDPQDVESFVYAEANQ